MLNKKGFTLVELLAVIAILGILSGFAIMAVSKYQKKATDDVYKNFIKQLKDGAINYLTSNISEIPSQKNGTITITSSDLKEKGYLDDIVDPIKKTKECTGTVKVTNNGNISNQSEEDNITYDENGNMIINSSNTKNLDLKYRVCLTCSQYSKCKEY